MAGFFTLPEVPDVPAEAQKAMSGFSTNLQNNMNTVKSGFSGNPFQLGQFAQDGPVYGNNNSATGGRAAPTPVADPGGIYPDSTPTPTAGPTQSTAPLAGPGYYEDWYKQHGQDLMTPSASEQLYAQGAAGSNPFYDYAQQQTLKAINDASAARGNSNSAYTMRTIGSAIADLRGQQAHELGQLAGQADQARAGRYDSTAGYADKAQGRMEDRATKSLDYDLLLGKDRADLVGGFYGEAGKEASTSELAAIEAMWKKGQLSTQDFMMLIQAMNQGSATMIKGAG